MPSEIGKESEHLQTSRSVLSKREYLSLLTIAFKSFARVFIVVDALDECTECDQRTFMSDLRSINSCKNVLVTSRPIDSIANIFENDDQTRIVASSNDMEGYIRNRIRDKSELSDMIEEDAEFEGRIIAMVLERAQNM